MGGPFRSVLLRAEEPRKHHLYAELQDELQRRSRGASQRDVDAAQRESRRLRHGYLISSTSSAPAVIRSAPAGRVILFTACMMTDFALAIRH